MREEGENVPPAPPPGPRNDANRGQGRRPEGRRGGRGNRGGGQRGQAFGSPSRSSRQQQWDPRRSEPREPAYGDQRKPNPSRPAPVIQHKQRRTIAGFVGALLGRKTEKEEKEES